MAFSTSSSDSKSWSTAVARTVNGEAQIHARVDGKKVIISEASIRRDLQLADEEGVDCLPNSTIFEQLALNGYDKTTAWNEFSSTVASAIICLATNRKFNFSKWIFGSLIRNLDNVSRKFLLYPRKPTRKVSKVPQPSDPIEHVVDEAVHKELGDSLVRVATTASSLEVECQEAIGDTTAQTRFESISKQSNDLLLARGNTLQSDEDRMKLNELMELCTNLQSRVLELEKTKTTQHNEIESLKRRIKKLERRNRSRTHKLKRLYKVGLTARVESFDNKDNLGEDASKQERMIDDINQDEEITLVNDQDDVEMFDVNDLGGEEVFVAEQTEKVVEEVVNAAQVKELEKSKKKDQIRLDEETAKRIQAEFDKEERLTRESSKKLEANIALIETWDDVQAKIDADYQLVKRLQAQEQEELTNGVEEKRNKPPTQAQQRKIMCTYLKNMEGYTLKRLKSFEFDKIKEMFDKALRWENTFEDFRIELMQGKEKKAGEELIQESSKKQKVEDDKETEELKELMEIIPDEEEVAIDAIPLAVKSPKIGRIVGIKSLLDVVGIIVAQVYVNTAQLKLVLLMELQENMLSSYYYWYKVETLLTMYLENKAHCESEKEAIHLLLTGIRYEIYSTFDACKIAHEIWIAIERLQQGESINIQNVKTNLFWEFGKFTSHDGESMESYYSRFYKIMNEMIINNLTIATIPQLISTQMKDKVMPNNSQVKFKKTEVEDHHRISSISNKTKSITACNDSLKSKTLNINVVCATCEKCMFNSNHDACVSKFLNDVNARTKKPKVIVQLILFIIDSGCTMHMTGNLKLLCNFVENYMGSVHFGNDQFAPILGYGDLVQGNITIKRVYYVKGLNHNLFSVGQFCDVDLEVAFQKSTCFVKDLHGNDLLTASPTQAWLLHGRISYLNFDYVNLLSNKDIVIRLPKLKYFKDQLCSSCELSKAKKKFIQEKGCSKFKTTAKFASCGLMWSNAGC
nr:hypothetical protein [Tanacetum cinerariifolium]